MIRAVVHKGVIQPLEPLPPDWQDGREVVVGDALEQPPRGTDDLDSWAQDMKMLTASLNDPQEWQQIEAALDEADRQSQALVHREMGLP